MQSPKPLVSELRWVCHSPPLYASGSRFSRYGRDTGLGVGHFSAGRDTGAIQIRGVSAPPVWAIDRCQPRHPYTGAAVRHGPVLLFAPSTATQPAPTVAGTTSKGDEGYATRGRSDGRSTGSRPGDRRPIRHRRLRPPLIQLTARALVAGTGRSMK